MNKFGEKDYLLEILYQYLRFFHHPRRIKYSRIFFIVVLIYTEIFNVTVLVNSLVFESYKEQIISITAFSFQQIACNALILYLMNGGTTQEELLSLIIKDVAALPDGSKKIKSEIYLRQKIVSVYCIFFWAFSFFSQTLVEPDLSFDDLTLTWMEFTGTRTGFFSGFFRCFNIICCFVYIYMYTFFILYLIHVDHYFAIYVRLVIGDILTELQKEEQEEYITFENLKRLADSINTCRRTAKIGNKLQGVFTVSIFPFTLTSFVGVLNFLMLDPLANLKVLFPCATVALGFGIAPLVGQVLIDRWETFRIELYKCPWMTWSKRNADIMRLTLATLLDIPILNTYGLLNYDFPLILKAVKLCYGFLTFLLQIRS